MDDRVLLNKFLRFESSNNLFKYEISNIKIWDIIRADIFFKIKTDGLTQTKKGDAQTPITSTINGLVSIVKSFLFNRNKIKHHEVLIFNHPRRKKVKELFVDIYSDYIIDNLNDEVSILTCESLFQMKHFKPAYTKNLYYLDSISFLQIFSNYLHAPKFNNFDFVSIIENKISEIFGVNVDIKKEITKVIPRYKFVYKKVERIIDAVNPKTIICIDGYSMVNKIAITIANKRGIPTIELQHGTVKDTKIAYNYTKGTNINSFPKYFFSWGNFWTKNISLPIGTIIKHVGFPFLEIEKKKYLLGNKEAKSILVLSQGTIGKELSKHIIDLANLLPSHNFYYKLHPSEVRGFKQTYTDLNKSNVRIITDKSVSLYDLFARCNIQIGVYSTAIAEGIGFGLRTIILKLYGYQTYSNIINESLFLSENVMKSRDYILLDEKNSASNIEFKESFFKSDALNNVSKEIKNIKRNE